MTSFLKSFKILVHLSQTLALGEEDSPDYLREFLRNYFKLHKEFGSEFRATVGRKYINRRVPKFLGNY